MKEKHLYKLDFNTTIWLAVYGGDYLEFPLLSISKPLFTHAYSERQAITYFRRDISGILLVPASRVFIDSAGVIDLTEIDLDI